MAFMVKQNIKRVKPNKPFLAKYMFKVSKKKGPTSRFFNASVLILERL